MQYQNELRKLKSLVSTDVWNMFERHNVIIAGGAITSVFCNREVNDLDVYFRTPEDYLRFCYDIFEGEFRFQLLVNNVTNRSILLKDKDTNQFVQLIIYKFFENELAVFKDYDFTCNMGALSFGWKKKGRNEDVQFVLHPEFMKHNSQRYLQFNTGTAYPLISALRVAKYVEKGYNISKAQMLRVLMAVNSVSLNSWEEVKDHVGGFYGLNMDEVFPEDKEFSIDLVLETLQELYADDKKYANIAQSLDDLYEPVRKYFEKEDFVPKENPENKYFKNVKKLDSGKLVSHYDNTFEYKVGECVNGGSQGIWVHKGESTLTGQYCGPNSIILELEGTLVSEHAWDMRMVGDVLVVAAYTKEEFTNKYQTKGKIPSHVRDMLDKYESGDEEEDF